MTVTIDAIQQQIHQAQQPLLARIEQLEKDLERAEDYLWKANALFHVLKYAYPAEQAAKAASDLQDMLNELPPEQWQSVPAQDVLATQRYFAQLAKRSS